MLSGDILTIISPQLDFQLASEEGDTGSFIPNGEWALLGRSQVSKQFNPQDRFFTLAFLPKVKSLYAFACLTNSKNTQFGQRNQKKHIIEMSSEENGQNTNRC